MLSRRRLGVSAPAALALSLLLVALSGCGGEGGGSPRRFLSLGTGGTGGIYYPLGGAIASLLSVEDTLRQYTAEVTGGSVENVNRIREGQIDMGFALGVTAYGAYHGSEDYDEAFPSLRIVAPLYANLLHILVPRGSQATSLADLAGGRISVGAAGSGTEQVSRQLLEAYGLSYDDVDVRYLTFSESAASIKDGAIDAAIISVGYPAAAVLDATTTGGARLLGVEPERVEELRERYPYYSVGEIPAGTYPGVVEAIPSVAMFNWIVGSESLEDDVVIRLLDLIRDNLRSLEQVHEMAGQIRVETLREAPIPLHPAAERWLNGG